MGDKSKNVIEINGRRYDAATGRPVKSSVKQSVRHIEGIAKAPTRAEIRRAQRAAKEVHQTTKKSVTLNRAATAKPAVPKQVQAAPIGEMRTPARAREQLSERVSEQRQQRAATTNKSAAIAKFAQNSAPAPVAPVAPVVPKIEETRPALTTQQVPQQTTKEQLIAEQLAKADDQHTTEKPKRSLKAFLKRRPKLVTTLATGASTLLVIAYVTYLNIPNMALRVAASRAGFEANMPGYRPNGFAFGGPISYSPGQITIGFQSNTDDRQFQITERETNWDSQSLLENYVKPETELYSTFQERGLTVYIYDGSSAAWVNGGIWYTIEGESLLSSEQLLKIATSL